MDLKKYFFQLLWNSEKIIFGILVILFFKTGISVVPNIVSSSSEIQRATITVTQKKNLLDELVLVDEDQYLELIEKIEKPYNFKSDIDRNLFSEIEYKKEVSKEKRIDIKEIKDRDEDGMPDEWEIRYGFDPNNADDSQVDADDDGWTNLDEFIHATDPNDPNSFPGQVRLRIKKIYKKKVQIKFFGYVKLPGDNYELQINWGRNTEFPKVGQKIRGYQIVDFTSNIQKRFNPLIGDYEIVDESFIRIQKTGRDPIKLILNKNSFEKELFAVIQDLDTGEEFVVHGGGRIKSYEVLDIMPTRVIIVRNKKIYTLTLERRS